MEEVRLRGFSRPKVPRLYRPMPRYTMVSETRREPISVRHFIRALTRFQPRHDTWQSEIPVIQSCVSEEFRRLHRRDNADFILSPRNPHSEFRPRSAHPDCKKEFVPKTNICFGKPGQKVPRRCIKSAPAASQRSVSAMSPRSSGRFEHNILQDEYYELRTMLRNSVQQKDTLDDIVSRPVGIYSHQYPSTNHRIFCMEDKVGMGYFKRFRKDLLDNLTLDLEGIGKERKDVHVDSDKTGEEKANDTTAILNYEKEASEKDVPKDSARSASSYGTSVSSFNSRGEVQTGHSKRKDSLKVVNAVPTVNLAVDSETSTSKDVSTSTADDICESKENIPE